MEGRDSFLAAGCDLLAECDADLPVPGRMTAATGSAFRSVASGESDARHLEYAWSIDGDVRWYRVELTALTSAPWRVRPRASARNIVSELARMSCPTTTRPNA